MSIKRSDAATTRWGSDAAPTAYEQMRLHLLANRKRHARRADNKLMGHLPCPSDARALGAAGAGADAAAGADADAATHIS